VQFVGTPLKAEDPTVGLPAANVVAALKSIIVSEVQPLKAFAPILAIFPSKTTLVSEAQPLKQLSGMALTPEGIVIEVIPVPKNAPSPIVVSVAGRLIEVILAQ